MKQSLLGWEEVGSSEEAWAGCEGAPARSPGFLCRIVAAEAARGRFLVWGGKVENTFNLLAKTWKIVFPPTPLLESQKEKFSSSSAFLFSFPYTTNETKPFTQRLLLVPLLLL